MHLHKWKHKDHNTGYEGTKSLASLATTKNAYDEPDIGIHPKFNPTGAQLSALTQTLAYKGICELKVPKCRQGTA